MKGLQKALQRTPHNITSRIGMAKKSTDPEYNEFERKFASVEAACDKMLKDSTSFRDSVTGLLYSGSNFSQSMATLFAPMGAEYNMSSKYPQSEVTLKNIDTYSQLMGELRETLTPELELIDSRIVSPCKELTDICKRIRKTCTKRDHKLVDYDRHNNSLNKLREKKEKSLSDEKNLFKVEQDFELASGEYEHFNNMLKTELPAFCTLATNFIDPIFHSFYYMQLNVYYIMLEKVQSYGEGKYDFQRKDIENIYHEQTSDAAEQIETLTITQRGITTAKLMQEHRRAGSSGGSSYLGRAGSSASRPSVDRKTSLTSSFASPTKAEYAAAPPPRTALAPPPYTSTLSSNSIKKAPPPLKPKPSYNATKYCTATFDFEAQAEGDLSFKAGDRIEIIEQSDNADDWWTGRLNGVQGIFPGTYTQVD